MDGRKPAIRSNQNKVMLPYRWTGKIQPYLLVGCASKPSSRGTSQQVSKTVALYLQRDAGNKSTIPAAYGGDG
jgi:hypothetical protein